MVRPSHLFPALHHRSCLLFAQSYNGYSNGYGGGGYGGGYGGYGGGYDDKMGNLGGSLRTVDWNTTKLERFEKNFYVEDKRVSSRSEREIEDFRREKEIKVCALSPIDTFSPLTPRQVQGRGVPWPVTAFDEVGFPEYLMSTIRAQGFPSPTPIQCQAWPMALSGRDLVAIAQTGSGKTISFALPAMLHINASVFLPCLVTLPAQGRVQPTIAQSWRWPNSVDSRANPRTCRSNPTRVHQIWVRIFYCDRI